MFKRIAATLVMLAAATGLASAEWITKTSDAPVAETADRLVAAVEEAGAKVFARVDHAAGAKTVGTELEPTTLLIFGNPKIGTPVIVADRRAALDLPIRVLIWEEKGATSIGYEDPAVLKERYDVKGADEAFATMTNALDKLTDAAASSD